MLPAHLAEAIHRQVLFYLQSTFDFRIREPKHVFARFLLKDETDSSRACGCSFSGCHNQSENT